MTATPGPYHREGRTVYALNVTGSNRFSAHVQGGYVFQSRQGNSERTTDEELEAVAAQFAKAWLIPEMEELLKAVGTHFEDTDSALGRRADALLAKLGETS